MIFGFEGILGDLDLWLVVIDVSVGGVMFGWGTLLGVFVSMVSLFAGARFLDELLLEGFVSELIACGLCLSGF